VVRKGTGDAAEKLPCMGLVLGRKPEHEILCFSPHLCVGFLFLILYPGLLLLLLLPPPP